MEGCVGSLFKRMLKCFIVSVMLFNFGMALVSAESADDFEMSTRISEVSESQFVLSFSGKNLQDLYAYEVRLQFDPSKLKVMNGKSSLNGFLVSPIVKDNIITMAFTKVGKVTGEKGKVELGTITFEATKVGTSSILWDSLIIIDSKLIKQEIDMEIGTDFVKLFKDITNHWAKEDIISMVDAGVIEGVNADTFAPNSNVTRSQFAALLARALKLDQTVTELPFKDVSANAWYAGGISAAYQAGLIQGMTAESYAPNAPITREQMATMIVRAKAFAEGTIVDTLSDASIEHFEDKVAIAPWAQKSVGIAIEEGLLNGRMNTKFAPKAQTTRAEAAVVIKRILQVKVN